MRVDVIIYYDAIMCGGDVMMGAIADVIMAVIAEICVCRCSYSILMLHK